MNKKEKKDENIGAPSPALLWESRKSWVKIWLAQQPLLLWLYKPKL